MPVHVHGDEEELFVVLEGSGVSFERRRRVSRSPPATRSCYPPRAARTRSSPGPTGMVVLAFGSGSDSALT